MNHIPEQTSAYNNEQDINDRKLRKTIRVDTGVGMIALGATAGTIVATTGMYDHWLPDSMRNIVGVAAGRAFMVLPDIALIRMGIGLVQEQKNQEDI